MFGFSGITGAKKKRGHVSAPVCFVVEGRADALIGESIVWLHARVVHKVREVPTEVPPAKTDRQAETAPNRAEKTGHDDQILGRAAIDTVEIFDPAEHEHVVRVIVLR